MPAPHVFACLQGLLDSKDYYDMISPELAKACPPIHGNDRIEIKLISPYAVQVKTHGLPFGVGLPNIPRIDFTGVEPNLLRLVIAFLYTGNYFDGEHPVIDQTPSLAALLTGQAVSQGLQTAPGVTDRSSCFSPAASCASLDLDLHGRTIHGDTENVADQQCPPLDPEDEKLLRRDMLREFEDVNFPSSPQSAGTSESGTLDVSYPHSMFTNLRLYLFSSALGIMPLKYLARERFFLSCVRHIEHEDFPTVIDELYTTTPPEDIIIRDLPCRLIAPRIRLFDDSFKDRIEPIMHKHGVLATGVMNYVIYSSYSRIIGIGAANSANSQ